MTVSSQVETKRAHALVHFGLSIIIAIPIIGTLLGLGAIVVFAFGIFVKSSDRMRDFVFLLAYPIVFFFAFGIVSWIFGFFFRGIDEYKALAAGCAATVPVSFYFIHTISGRTGEY